MRRFAANRWMALVLAIAMSTATLIASYGTASADPFMGGDGGDDGGVGGSSGGVTNPPVPGPGNYGDPDVPETGVKRLSPRMQVGRLASTQTNSTAGDGRVASVSWLQRYQWVLKAYLKAFMR